MKDRTENGNALEGSDEFHLAVRSGLVGIGESFHRWCLTRGYGDANVRAATKGKWNGPRARELRRELLTYLQDRGVSI